MDEVRRKEFGEERGYDVAEQDDAFWDRRTNEIEGSGENDDIEDIVYESCCWSDLSVVGEG